jgi:hypothetical protein
MRKHQRQVAESRGEGGERGKSLVNIHSVTFSNTSFHSPFSVKTPPRRGPITLLIAKTAL